MKVVHIIDFFHPNAGYQLNVLTKYIVKFGHEDIIVTSQLDTVDPSLINFFGKDTIDKDDKEFEIKTGVKVRRLPLIAYWSGRAIFTKELQEVVASLEPDILFIHDVDTLVGIKYVLNIKKIKFPVIFNSTMLEMASLNPLRKQFRWFFKTFVTPKVVKHELKTIRIQDDNYLEKHLGIPISLCPYISVGSDTMLFNPNKLVRNEFRKENLISMNDFVVIYTGKLDEAKGAMLLAEAFKSKFIDARNRNVVLIVVGNFTGEYGKQVERIFKESENQIVMFPTQKYMNLAKYYQASDLSVFPKECSLSFYDAQACGLPVISEDNNVNLDRLSFNNGMNFIKGDIKDLRLKVQYFLDMKVEDYSIMSENATRYVKTNYDYENIAQSYLDVLESEYSRFHALKDSKYGV